MKMARTFYRLGFLGLLTFIIAGCDVQHPKPATPPPPTVDVSTPLERTVTDYQIFTARTQAVQSVDVKARVTGYLTKITFEDGGLVKKNQVLFEIDDRPYKAALDKAKAAVVVAQASLVKAQAELDIGLSVQRDDRGAISQQDIVKRRGSRDEARGTLGEARANLANAQLNFDWCKVTSPIDGRANTHFLDIGNVVSQNVTTLTNIVSLKPIWAYFNVDENTLLRFQQNVEEGKTRGPRHTVIDVAMALGNDTGFPFKGTIDFISNQVDANTGSIRVRAVFPNDDERLAAGLFGRIRVPIGPAHQALLVSDRAIGTEQGQKYVLLVNDKNEVEERAVQVGQLHLGLREVLRYRTIVDSDDGGKVATKKVEALKPTDRIIVDGLQRVRPGIEVKPRAVDMQTLKPAAKP
jgi:RND family efflux transporter MFP subunit